MKTVYQTNDSKVFMTQEQAAAHEKLLQIALRMSRLLATCTDSITDHAAGELAGALVFSKPLQGLSLFELLQAVYGSGQVDKP